jgi:hypothetical protein
VLTTILQELGLVKRDEDNIPIKQRKSKRTIRKERTTRMWAISMVLIALPYDVLLWGTGAQNLIALVRLGRMVLAPMQIHLWIAANERTQNISFSTCRFLRIMLFFVVMSHWLGCAFHYMARNDDADQSAVEAPTRGYRAPDACSFPPSSPVVWQLR